MDNRLQPDFAFGFRRFFAFIIDHYLVGFVAYSITASLGLTEDFSVNGFLVVMLPSSLDSVQGSDIVWWLILGLGVSYFIIAEWRFGRTFGKVILYLRVVDSEYAGLSFRQSLIRNAMKYVELVLTLMFFGILVLGLLISRTTVWFGTLRMFGPPPRQRWGDQLAGTYVVRGQWTPLRPKSRASASFITGETPKPPPAIADPASAIRLSGRKPNS